MRTPSKNYLGAIMGLAGLWAWTVCPAPAAAGDEPVAWNHMFDTSDQCLACHNGLKDSQGRDISIGLNWRPTMMANAARDPYWHAGVRREIIDHPKAQAAIEAECSICHMPMARFTAHAGGGEGTIFENLPIGKSEARLAHLAADGVSCTVCHQMAADGLGERKSFVGRFVVDQKKAPGERLIYGPYDVDEGRVQLMNSGSQFTPKEAKHIRESGMCGSCHTLITHALGPDGKVIGELPEQVPYLEWLHSRYPKSNSCQSCHMKKVDGPAHISSVVGQPREDVMQHVFRGGNFFIPRLLDQYRSELGSRAQSAEFQNASEQTLLNLKEDTARLQLSDIGMTQGRVEVAVTVQNVTGHKLPTAYPSRRVWIHFTVSDSAGQVLFESGALNSDGSIVGNVNDEAAGKFERHYDRIESGDQVQIYEPILAGPDGSVTTGLLTATSYIKDNRLLPEGFDKSSAGHEIAVRGEAEKDDNFAGGSDRIVYSLDLKGAQGPLKIKVELLYQTIGYRWAHNLGQYKAHEPQRFVRYYKAAADRSSALLAAADGRLNPVVTPAPEEKPAEEKTADEKPAVTPATPEAKTK